MIRDTEDMVAHTVHCAKVHKANFVCTCGADLATAEKRIQSLSDRIDVLGAENAALRAKRKMKIVPAPPVVFEDETRAALHQEGIATDVGR